MRTPILALQLRVLYIRGYQGNDLLRPDSVAASVKHFAAYGAAEAGREYNTTDMSESRLRDIYLPPYKAAVDAGAVTMMSAFNALNGVPATANPYLLQTILRDQDYTAVHGTYASRRCFDSCNRDREGIRSRNRHRHDVALL